MDSSGSLAFRLSPPHRTVHGSVPHSSQATCVFSSSEAAAEAAISLAVMLSLSSMSSIAAFASRMVVGGAAEDDDEDDVAGSGSVDLRLCSGGLVS